MEHYGSYWLKPGVVRQEQQITVCLLQTMISRYLGLPAATLMWLWLTSVTAIYGVWWHFDALHIGLTATPTAYIERNTFEFYKCTGEQPDFSVIQDAFRTSIWFPIVLPLVSPRLLLKALMLMMSTMTQQVLSGSGRMRTPTAK